MTAPRVSEERAKEILLQFEKSFGLTPLNVVSSLVVLLIAERTVLEAQLAEAERLAAVVLNERASRQVGGADECYTDNARSRGREHRATEALLLTLRREAGEAGE